LAKIQNWLRSTKISPERALVWSRCEQAPPAKRGPVPKLQQQMERIQRLPKSQQRFVMQMIDTALAQQGR